MGKLCGILMGLFLAAAMVGLGVSLAGRGEINIDPFAQERAASAFRRSQWWAGTLTVAGVMLLAAVLLGVLGVALAIVRRANLRAGEIRPIDGLFPVHRNRMLAWYNGPRMVTYYHDPNRAAGPTTVYAAVGAGDRLQVRQIQIEEVSPAQERITARSQAVAAVAALPRGLRNMGNNSSNSSGRPTVSALPEPTTFPFPSEVSLANLLPESPSLERLVMGVTVDQETGQQDVVRAPMGQLVHGAVGGSSGWGKSVFLRAMGYQLAMADEECQLAMIDLEGATFAPFARCGRLLYPVADNESDARAILTTLLDELNRRRELFQRYPGVDSLAAYNAIDKKMLPPIICLIDEATALLGNRQVHSAARTLAMRSRKYGIWLWMGGQDWKASSLDTAIRNNLGTRVQFKALSKSQSRVLLQQPGAEELDIPGRALAILPGRQMVELQAPYISHRQIAADVHNGGPMHNMPIEAEVMVVDERVQRVLELAASGQSVTAIARQVYKHGNSFYIDKVRAILDAHNNNNHDNSTAVH